MRILILCDVLYPQTVGGAGRVARELGEGFKACGDAVHYLTRPVVSGPTEGEDTSYLPPLRLDALLDFRRRFSEVAARFNPDIVHFHQPLSAYLSIPADYGRPLVYTFHSPWPREFAIKHSRIPASLRRLAMPLMRRMEGAMVSRASEVVVASDFMGAQVRSLHGREPVTIHHGVDPQRFSPVREKPFGTRKRLVTLRNLVPRMGLIELIDAIALLPESVHLEIGGEGPMRRALQRRIEALRLESRVRLAGHVREEQLPAFYSDADWFVLPTLELEGFGLVILESLACGTPVLGTRVGAIPEVLGRFDPRWIIPEPTARAIADTVRAALDTAAPDPQELHRKVAAQFDWRRVVQVYREVFQMRGNSYGAR
jgi:glycosyltransferase involved in cell wall biosynthesis